MSTWLILDASGVVTDICVGQPPAAAIPPGASAVDAAGQPAGAGIGWVRGADGVLAPPGSGLPADLVAYAADARWRLEVGGTTWNGWPIYTDDRAQIKYLAELAAIEAGVRADGEPWKFADGIPRPLTNLQMRDLAIKARSYVTGTFGREFAVLAAIKAGTVTSAAEVDAMLAGAVA